MKAHKTEQGERESDLNLHRDKEWLI